MKQLAFSAALAMVVLSGGATAHAQQPGSLDVALIDLAYIFKNHNHFQSLKAGLQKDFDLAQVDFQTRRARIQQIAKQLEGFKPGSPERKQTERKLAQEQSNMQVEATLLKKQFIERDAKNFYDVYKQVVDEVGAYCKQRRIRLVFQFNGEPLDNNDPQSVPLQLTRKVVYYDKALDITPYILSQLNRNGPAGSRPRTTRQNIPFPR